MPAYIKNKASTDHEVAENILDDAKDARTGGWNF